MNTINHFLKKAMLSFLVAVLAVAAAGAQEGKLEKEEGQAAALEQMLASKNFVFRAQSALPMNGSTIQLTYGYDLTLSGDSLVAHLPYFGRAYSAQMDPAEAGLRFTATRFEYRIKERRKGGWEVFLRPRDAREVQQMWLHVSGNGFATLQVTGLNRQPISFTGYIEKLKEKK